MSLIFILADQSSAMYFGMMHDTNNAGIKAPWTPIKFAGMQECACMYYLLLRPKLLLLQRHRCCPSGCTRFHPT